MSTFRDAIQMVIDSNQKLLAGTIDVNIANQIAINTQVIINAAKVSIDVMKVTGQMSNSFLTFDKSNNESSADCFDVKKIIEMGESERPVPR